MVTRPAVPPYSSSTIGQVDLEPLHVGQHVLDLAGARDEERGPHDVATRAGLRAEGREDILGVDHAADFVERDGIDRIAGAPGLGHDVGGLLRR